jgi:hypothetical protein
MEPFFTSLFSGTMWGAFMGAGLGTFSGMLAMYRKEPPKTLRFKHPVTNKTIEFDTYGLDDDVGIVALMRRIQESLNVDPSIRDVAKRQFRVILTKVHNFFHVLKLYQENIHMLRYKIKTRKLATLASQAITNFEPYIWDSQEIETVMNSLGIVQKTIIDKMLFLDK